MQWLHIDNLPALEKNANLAVFVTDPRGTQGLLRPNHLQPPFNNKKVRQALNVAINRKELLSTVFAGKGTLTYVTGWSEKIVPARGDNGSWSGRPRPLVRTPFSAARPMHGERLSPPRAPGILVGICGMGGIA